jgi:hypothetical protein
MNPHPSLAALSAFVLLSVSQIACGGADPSSAGVDDANASSEEDLSNGTKVSFKDFKATVDDEGSRMNDIDECGFGTSDVAGGVKITVRNGGDSTDIVVKATDSIRLSTDKEGSQIYKIRGVGTVTLLTADDAFQRDSVSSTTTHKSTECEIDF